ncbi:MAG: hypothetical protein OEV00_13710 [Acidobacteriota bacterium]|nr:hypothetical protein [Acidobacteriota bacterium]MDH3786366.1 hypothetical protein [Acidobacteriota bacterium]
MTANPTPVTGRPIIIAAVVIGGSILAGSFLLNGSLRQTAARLTGIQESLTQTTDELKTLASNRPAAPRRRGPDPNKRHTINTKGAPFKGPAVAKVELVEFSDFQ